MVHGMDCTSCALCMLNKKTTTFHIVCKPHSQTLARHSAYRCGVFGFSVHKCNQNIYSIKTSVIQNDKLHHHVCTLPHKHIMIGYVHVLSALSKHFEASTHFAS